MEAFEMPMLVTVLGNFGFPIAVAIYLLIRFEKKIEKLSSTVQELRNSMKK